MPSNCPAIAQAYSKQCRDAQGGVLKFYITEHANISSYTEASGVLTAITMVSGKKFWLYEQETESANYTDNPTPSSVNGTNFFEQTFNAVLLKRSAAISYSLRALSQQNVCIIAVEQTGTMFILGIKNGMVMNPSVGTSGTAMGDRNGYELAWLGKEPHSSYTISQAILDTIIV